MYEKKSCKKCGKKLKKSGVTAAGTQRYKCTVCGSYEVRKRIDHTLRHRSTVFHEWLLGKQELKVFANKYGVSTRTLSNWFRDFWDQGIDPQNLSISGQVIIIDGYVLEEGCVLLLVKTTDSVIFWTFAQRETYLSWHACLSQVRGHPTTIVCDCQKGMFKAINELFPRVLIQRCHFHVQQRNRQLLTMNPETLPGIAFNNLVKELPKLKNHAEYRAWVTQYQSWMSRHKNYLSQKTHYPFDTQYIYKNFTKGKRNFFYTHQRLRAAVYQIKTALPNLFHFLQHSNIPKTTNHIEGGINSQLKLLLRLHRGLPLQKRKYLVAYFLSQKQTKILLN